MHINELSNFLSQPWMSKFHWFQNDINSLVEASQKKCDPFKGMQHNDSRDAKININV